MSQEKFYYNIKPFKGENFNTWLYRLKSILAEHECLDAVLNAGFVSIEENKKLEARAQSIIISAVADSHIEYIREENTAYAMIKRLENNFLKRNTRSKMFLRRQLSEMAYNEQNKLSEHFSKMDEIFTLLQGAGTNLSEEEKVNYILLSMPKSYEMVVTTLETINDLKVDFVKDRLLGEEEKQKKGNVNKQYSEASTSSFLCYSCGKPGHKKYQCYHRGRGNKGHVNYGYSRGEHSYNNKTEAMGNRGPLHAVGQRSTPVRRGYSQGRGQRGFSSNNTRGSFMADNQESEASNSNAFICNQNYDSCDNLIWYIDSGCSDHLNNNKNLFNDGFMMLDKPKLISAAKNGITLKALGFGNIRVKTTIDNIVHYHLIKNVYYVPELRKNLLSVSKMESAGFSIIFYNGLVKIYNPKNVLIMIGKAEGSLYSIKLEMNNMFCNFSNDNNGVVDLWHRRFAHLGINNLNKLVKQNLVLGLTDLKNMKIENTLCETCLSGSMTRLPFNKMGHRASKPLELVHSDVCGPITPTTWDGFKYFVTFIDDYTHFVMVYLIKNKSEVFEKFKQYYNYVTKHFNRDLLTLRTDNGGEYLMNEFKQFCLDKGITLQNTVAYNPEMNGVAERMNRTLNDRSRTILIESKLDKSLWGEAVLYSAYVTNRCPTASKEKTPSELWEGRKPDVSGMKVFGSFAFNHIPKEHRKKFDPKAKKMVMVGYSLNGYKLWDEENERVIVARNVIFDEKIQKDEKHVKIPINNEEVEKIEMELRERDMKDLEINEQSDEIENQADERNQNSKRDKRQIKKPIWQNDYITDFEDENDEVLFVLMAEQEENVPHCFEEINEREDRQLWKEAVQEEIKVLEESETWVKVPRKNIKELDTKWIFTKKIVGGKQVYKARLVVKGFQQRDNFNDIYSPVLKMQTLRILLAVAVERNYNICQMDVKGAFLYGRIEEEVYIKPPQGYSNINNGLIDKYSLKLKKSLYGLKRSPKYWYEHFTEIITAYGFTRSENDYCLYIKNDFYILLYVDDLLILGKDKEQIKEIKNFLSSQFRMKDLSNSDMMYLGISIQRQENSISINQSVYLNNILKKFGMQDCKGIDTPMDYNFKFDDSIVDMSYEKQCRSLIGSLMYATVSSRPDLAFSVYYLSRYQSKPNDCLWKALKRILRYIKQTIDYSLIFEKKSKNPIVGYADADWGRDIDRKSTTGYLFQIYGNTVVWKSRKQSVIALSTTEAELISLCESAVESCWIYKLLVDLGIEIETVEIYEDNQSTIRSVNTYDQRKLKHLEIKYNFIKQKVEQGFITVKYVKSSEQLADVLTKPVNKNSFKNLVNRLGIVNMVKMIDN